MHSTTQTLEHPPRWGFEWPTWLVIATIYGGWFGLVYHFGSLPGWVSYPGLIVITAWFMSLEHEVLHGHPTPWPAFNRLFVLFPICPWFPFDIYKATHLAHHQDAFLTTPGVDPEANYLEASRFESLASWKQGLYKGLRTVLGRSVVGSVLAVVDTWHTYLSELLRGNFRYLSTWLIHLGLLAVLLWYLELQAGIGLLHWVVLIAWPALILAMLRSFYEHRPAALPAHRIVINEAAWPWRLLYLNNNFHSVHHDHPELPWYKIERAYRHDRAGYLARNGNFLLPGYLFLVRRYFLKPVDSARHPGFGITHPDA